MLVQEIDAVRPEALERSVDHRLDVLGPAVQTTSASVEVEAELRRDPDAVANRRERFADESFARVRSVDFSGVEKRDASFMRFTENLDALVSVCRGSVVGADAHERRVPISETVSVPSCRVFILSDLKPTPCCLQCSRSRSEEMFAGSAKSLA